MLPFTLSAPAKINLALHVLGRRPDGYHELDSIVAFADVGDRLSFAEATDFKLTADGPFAGDLPPAGGNIIARAWDLARRLATARGTSLPPVAVRLTKNLPVASGIGGGSANAAAALKGFLRLAGIDAASDGIAAEALGLGADVPVCLFGKPCRMQGVGERISCLPEFAPRHALLVNPRVEVATAAVFRQLGLAPGESYRAAIADDADPATWRNDLTEPALAMAPAIGGVLQRLKAIPGVTRAFMSGSGATCVALGESPLIPQGLPQHWWATQAMIG